MSRPVPTTLAVLVLVASSLAQGDKTLPLRRVLTAPQTLFEFLPRDQWIPGSQSFSRIELPDRGKVSVLRPGLTGEPERFTANQFHAAFAKGEEPARPGPIPEFTWVDAETIRVRGPDGIYHWKLGTDKARLVLPIPTDASGAAPEPLATAADDGRVAFVKDHQLHVQIGATAPKQITDDGSSDIVYGGPAHRSEFGIHDGLWWSPNNRYLAFFREDLTPITPYPYVDHTTLPPKALHGRYPMAGGKNSFVQVGIYDTGTDTLRYLSLDGDAEDRGALDVYWTNVTFDPSSRHVYIAVVNRDQNHMDLVRFEAATGRLDAKLFAEEDKEWVEPEHGPIFLNDASGRFLWFSSRDGYRHLYLYDAEGKLQKQLTRGSFDIHEFVGFGKSAAKAYVMTSGENPLQMQLWEFDVETGEGRPVTRERGWHTCSLSPDGAFVLDRFSNLALPGQSRVIDVATGKTSHERKVGHRFPVMGKQSLFDVQSDSGDKLYGTMILPPGLDATESKKYPVLLYVYGGPHSQLVRDQWLGGSSVWLHYMATRGFIVCTLDNRGTDNRGIAFSQSVFRRLGELETADQLKAVEYLKALPYVDAARIGVHGWSYGGYMTLNLMLRSPAGTFACGASGAPVTDWRQYETGYTERYMDTPAQNPEGFTQASVLERVKKLTGRLLVIHGTDDKTVMWSQTLAFVDRCVRANVLVEYMPYPMQKHGIRGGARVHLYLLLTRFFQEHLQGKR